MAIDEQIYFIFEQEFYRISLVTGTEKKSCLSSFINTRVTRRVSLVQEELLTLPEHMVATRLLAGVRVDRSLVFSKVFCR